MTTTATTPPAPPHIALRIGLIVVAAIETLTALSDFSGIFYDYQHETRLLQFAQALGSAKLALAPAIASAALAFAGLGRLRQAIFALAALVLVGWLSELPSFAIHGLELSATFGGMVVFVQRFVYPALAVAAIVLAMKGERLALAGVLVSLPTVFYWAVGLVFMIGFMIYGF